MSTALGMITIIKTVYYYSLTGKTEAILDDINEIVTIKLNRIDPKSFNFNDSSSIFIGTPTYGRGAPPKYFLEILPQIKNLKNKNIGLFGSGNTVYGEDYCGALDVLEELLKVNNKILFKYKFEGYPKISDQANLKKLIEEV